jgi:16S rRNA (guanine(966)-N(2))-methyltransferase RsmD
MRVIAGSLKGRRLRSPEWDGLRPTSDKLRETLFNILAPRIAGARVLDGYAGTGALGIEAISRGASEVMFVESDRRAQALIAGNLAQCGIDSGYTVVRGPVSRAIRDAQTNPHFVPFDIVLFDPPYDALPDAVLAGADAALAPEGVLVLEHATKQAAPDIAGRLVRQRDLRSGDSMLTFYGLHR